MIRGTMCQEQWLYLIHQHHHTNRIFKTWHIPILCTAKETHTFFKNCNARLPGSHSIHCQTFILDVLTIGFNSWVSKTTSSRLRKDLFQWKRSHIGLVLADTESTAQKYTVWFNHSGFEQENKFFFVAHFTWMLSISTSKPPGGAVLNGELNYNVNVANSTVHLYAEIPQKKLAV